MGNLFSSTRRTTETVPQPSRSRGNNSNTGRTSGNVIREYYQPHVTRGTYWAAPSPERSWAYNEPSGRSNGNVYRVYDPSHVSSVTHVTGSSPERIWAYNGATGRSGGNVPRVYYESHGSSGTPWSVPSPARNFAYNGATSRSNENLSRDYHVSYGSRGPSSHTGRSRIRPTGWTYEYAPGDHYVSNGSNGTVGTALPPVRSPDYNWDTRLEYGNDTDVYRVTSESGWNNLEPTYTKPITPKADNGEVITVRNVTLNVKSNAKEHHTDAFDITDGSSSGGQGSLVIRRGQKFHLNIGLTRDYVFGKDDLRIFLKFGGKPSKENGTYLEFIPSDKGASNTLGAYIESYDKRGVNIAIVTPPTSPVGKWEMHIDLVQRYNNKPTVFRHTHNDPVYILFNPWCEDDQVYMYEKDEPLLLEYVLNEAGKIYAGNWQKPTAKPWDFGQFTGKVLDCILYLLEQSTLEDEQRGDPILVSRKLSALVNSNDDKGVLVGNWSGNYSEGTSPLKWTGSVAILNEYYQTKQPVRYAQCWVFSGVLTTACRALGLPARSVSNFLSAHDTDGSITIDTYFKENGELDATRNRDSVWNFHVWNDVWMARPDLPSGYGGWQAIDSTPQETSKGVFRMGPMSLEAIKSGDVDLSYDGKFVFAEVNGDKVYWLVYENNKEVVTSIDEYGIGLKISTKKAFTNVPWRDYASSEDPDREDVTDQYKYPDGSVEERAAVRRANMESSRDIVYKTLAEDVTFEISTDPNTFIGDTVKIALTISNTSSEERTVNGRLLLSTMYYTGATYRDAEEKVVDDLKLDPYDKKVIFIEEPVGGYLDKLMDHCMFKISCMCLVGETKQVFSKVDILRLRKPHLDVKAPDEGTVGDTFSVEVSFDNPLPMTLTDCELRVEGAHLQIPIIYKQGDVEAYQKFTGYFEMTPKKPGLRTIVVYFNCFPIDSVNASHEIQIKAN